jgi:hypothetical protein
MLKHCFAGPVVTAMFILSCAGQHVRTAGTARDADVIRAVLEAIAAKGQSHAYVVAGTTAPYNPWIEPNPSRTVDATIPAELIDVYADANRIRRPLPPEALPGRFRLIDPLQIRQHFQHGPREGWEAVEASYGVGTGLVRISAPAYSARFDAALITYSYDYAPLGGETNYVVLHRANGRWTVTWTGHLGLS